MNVVVAFPSVARGYLLRKMRNMGLSECLVKQTESVMRGKRVIMSDDGQDGEPMDVPTGLPQCSLVSPVLVAIYIAEVHGAAEGQAEGSRDTSRMEEVPG